MPVQQTFLASRNATWNPPLVYGYEGAQAPLTDARLDMQLRLYPGAEGDPLLSIAGITWSDNLVSGTAGGADEERELTLDLNGGFSPDQLGTLPGLAANAMAALAVLAGLPASTAVEVGVALEFYFDILITYADGVTEILSSGSFILSPGVTQL